MCPNFPGSQNCLSGQVRWNGCGWLAIFATTGFGLEGPSTWPTSKSVSCRRHSVTARVFLIYSKWEQEQSEWHTMCPYVSVCSMTFKLSYIYSALYYTLYIYRDIYTTSFQPHFNAQTACHPVKGCKSATEVRRLKMPRRNPCFFGSSGFALAVPVNSLEATLSNRNFQRAVEDKKRWKIVMLHNYRGSPTQGHTIAWKHLYETRRLERLHSPSCRHQNLFQPNSARVRYLLPSSTYSQHQLPFQSIPAAAMRPNWVAA